MRLQLQRRKRAKEDRKLQLSGRYVRASFLSHTNSKMLHSVSLSGNKQNCQSSLHYNARWWRIHTNQNNEISQWPFSRSICHWRNSKGAFLLYLCRFWPLECFCCFFVDRQLQLTTHNPCSTCSYGSTEILHECTSLNLQITQSFLTADILTCHSRGEE